VWASGSQLASRRLVRGWGTGERVQRAGQGCIRERMKLSVPLAKVGVSEHDYGVYGGDCHVAYGGIGAPSGGSGHAPNTACRPPTDRGRGICPGGHEASQALSACDWSGWGSRWLELEIVRLHYAKTLMDNFSGHLSAFMIKSSAFTETRQMLAQYFQAGMEHIFDTPPPAVGGSMPAELTVRRVRNIITPNLKECVRCGHEFHLDVVVCKAGQDKGEDILLLGRGHITARG
jgi:hypothetical protein